MSTTLQNSIWPNAGGTLGEIKTQIPDGVTVKWPDGDALVGNFVYKDGKLIGLVDTKALIENDSKTTVLPYDFVDITVDKRLETLMTFNAGERCKRLNVKYDIFLPKGYKRLEYLESTGTQYINAGVKLGNESEVKCEWELVAQANYDQTLYGVVTKFGAYADTSAAPEIPHFYYGGEAKYYWDFSGKHAVVHNSKSVTLDGVTQYFSEGTEMTEEVTAYLFNYFSYTQGALARVYSFTISRAGEMQLNFIPCLDPNGAPCMYDIMSQEPFYNEGAGQFLYPGAESQVVTSDLDEIFYAKKTAHGIQKLYHVPENFSGSKDEYAIENGFKQLVEPPMPIEGYWSPQWIETDTQLICNWVEVDVPEI